MGGRQLSKHTLGQDRTSNPGKCQTNVQECTNKTNPATFKLATGTIGFFCRDLCWPSAYLSEPVKSRTPRPECMIDWNEDICGGACDASKPTAFYSTSNWTLMECRDWLQEGLAKCP
jgi:hypothetical protein